MQDEELIRAASGAPWQVWFTERCREIPGQAVTDVEAEVRFVPPAGCKASDLFGLDLRVVASDWKGGVWELTVRPYRGQWIENRGKLSLRAAGVGTPKRLSATTAQGAT